MGGEGLEAPDLSDKEVRAYSITRALEAVASLGGRERSLETDISDELDRMLSSTVVRQSSNSVWVPPEDGGRATGAPVLDRVRAALAEQGHG